MLFAAFVVALGLTATVAFKTEINGHREEEIMIPMRDGVKLHS
jgi:predicted acyl esterase